LLVYAEIKSVLLCEVTLRYEARVKNLR
jgi:hypothetical protein